MLVLLNKIFVRPFYRANAGFFLFFFFVFFGAVQGGSLVSYHLSLMNRILSSGITLSIVLFCWLLYHLKCVGFFLKIINSHEGEFLYNLQAFEKSGQWKLYTTIYSLVYAPVLVYSIVLSTVGFQKDFVQSSMIIFLFQIVSLGISSTLIYYRLNNWIARISMPSLTILFRKQFLLYNLFYLTTQKRSLFLVLKALSLLLLYIILVWNKGKYDSDSFLLFYLLILLGHALLPYLLIQFMEKKLAVSRNLPLSLFKRAAAYLIPYFIFLLPELAYLLYHADALPIEHRFAYYLNLVISLFLLTAILYSDAFDRNEYLKAIFALFFLSIFALHIHAFWLWISIQLMISLVLFKSGFYSYEPNNT
jgi:hypothetical protein